MQTTTERMVRTGVSLGLAMVYTSAGAFAGPRFAGSLTSNPLESLPVVGQALQMHGLGILPAPPAPRATLVEGAAHTTPSDDARDSARAVVVLDFDDAETSGVESGQVSAGPYLRRHGITISALSQGTEVRIINNGKLYGGAGSAPSHKNVLTQNESSDPIFFILAFDKPLRHFGFSRPKLLAGEKGITHPIWIARAYDVDGNEIIQQSQPSRQGLPLSEAPGDVIRNCVQQFHLLPSAQNQEPWVLSESWGYVGECMIRSYEHVRARSFTLNGAERGIKSVRIDSVNGHFAAFSAVLLEGIEFQTQ